MKYLNVIILAFCLVTTGNVHASKYKDQVQAQMAFIELAVQSSELKATHETLIDSLAEGDAEVVTVTLRKNVSYRLVAVCDEDCADIDLTLYDENNNRISDSMGTDDLPMVRVTPKWTGEYKVKVDMYRCQENPCTYGIGVFGT